MSAPIGNPGVERATVVANTGWNIQFFEDCGETPAPNSVELETLRELKARTAAAHGVQGNEA